jgi:hypothetical protein
MLWTAGQERVGREGRERLAELYVGVRDGTVAADVAVGRAKARGDSYVPSYARSSDAPAPDAAAEQRATLARLGAMVPGAIRRASS